MYGEAATVLGALILFLLGWGIANVNRNSARRDADKMNKVGKALHDGSVHCPNCEATDWTGHDSGVGHYYKMTCEHCSTTLNNHDFETLMRGEELPHNAISMIRLRAKPTTKSAK